MKENEALECLKSSKRKNDILGILPVSDIGNTIIKALEEVQQYRQIGTVEECRAAVEKQNAKKVILFEYNNGSVNYGCPVCKRKIISKIDGKWCGGTFNEYCDRCGQKLDWRNEE